MKINPSHSEPVGGVRPRPASRSESSRKPGTSGTEELKAGQKQKLSDLLGSEPEVRADMLEKARQLAADTNYPSIDVLNEVAKRLFDKH